MLFILYVLKDESLEKGNATTASLPQPQANTQVTVNKSSDSSSSSSSEFVSASFHPSVAQNVELSSSSSSSSFQSFNALLTDRNNNALPKSPRPETDANLTPTNSRNKQQRKSESDVQVQGVALNMEPVKGAKPMPDKTGKNLAFSPLLPAKSNQTKSKHL